MCMVKNKIMHIINKSQNQALFKIEYLYSDIYVNANLKNIHANKLLSFKCKI